MVRGGQGDDLLQGGDGPDTLSGDLGANTLVGGTDSINGGAQVVLVGIQLSTLSGDWIIAGGP
jgi:Ca2+-binding RTX toxin-like protein